MPASMHRRRSCSMALAVMATIGSFAQPCELRISRVAVDAVHHRHLHVHEHQVEARLSAPSPARSGRCRRPRPPSRRRPAVRAPTCWLRSLSSTSRMRAPRRAARPDGRPRARGVSATARRRARPAPHGGVEQDRRAHRLDQHVCDARAFGLLQHFLAAVGGHHQEHRRRRQARAPGCGAPPPCRPCRACASRDRRCRRGGRRSAA